MSVGKVSEFDIKTGVWSSYIERLQSYFTVNGVGDELKLPTLIAVMGDEAYELLSDLASPRKPSEVTFKEAVDMLGNHLQPTPSALAERFRFRQRRQAADESIASYVAELKKLTRNCKLGANLAENLRDQFICGLRSDVIRQRLFAELDTLDFTNAVKIATSMEAAERDAAAVEIQGPAAASSEVHSLSIDGGSGRAGGAGGAGARTRGANAGQRRGAGGAAARGGRGHVSPSTRGPARNAGYAGRNMAGNEFNNYGCRGCGATDHNYGTCRFRTYVCSRCKRTGHLRRVCPVRDASGRGAGGAALNYGATEEAPVPAEEEQSTYYEEFHHLCLNDYKAISAILLMYLHLSTHVVNEGHAVNPSCTCIRFTSTYNKERGTFTSPDYPRAYPPRIDCLLYTFLAAPHEIVELLFTDFDIYKDPHDCIRGDYLKVYWEVQGPGPPGSINERSAWARTLCGNRAEAPAALYSPGPALVLEFHTGHKHYNATGFVGTYSFIDKRLFDTEGVRVPGTECDFQFSRSGSRPAHGRFYSPRYPSIYPNNVRCSYHFHARPKERVKVIFEEVSLQKGDISCLRRADIIKVFDGRDTNSPAIAMLCNELTGYEVLSTGPALLLQFTANSAFPGQGFAATFTFQPPPDSTAADSDRLLKLSFGKAFESLGPEVSATTSSCHQEFSSDVTKHGTLSSPHYPSPYPPNTHCHYEFFGRGKERVRLIFQDFYLYKSPDGALDCTNVDSLQAFVNVAGRLEKVETYCGINLPKPIMSNGPKLMLEFRGTQSSRFSRGFKISYAFVENFGITSGRQLKEFPCAFVYNSSESRNGTFASPNSPGPYPRDTECSYFFYGGETEKVHLHFTNFDVEGVLPCEAVSASDYVEFSNYMTEDNRYGRYCGQMKEFHVESERNFFKVTFKSNDRLDGSGFKAVYQFLEASDEYRAPPVEDGANKLNTFGCTLTLITFAIILLHHHL